MRLTARTMRPSIPDPWQSALVNPARLFLLTLGVDTAPSRDLDALRFAGADAEAVRAGLLTQRHYASTVDLPVAADADRANVLDMVSDAARRTGPRDAMIFFYAGHGVVEADEHGQAGHFLTCRGIRPDAIADTAVALEDLMDALGQASCGTVVALLDCCYSGGRGSRSFLGPVAANLARTGRSLGWAPLRPPPGVGRLMISASSRAQPAHEDGDLRHGLFTFALLQALEPVEGSTSVPVYDLYGHVKRRCVQLSGGLQVPSWSGSDENAHLPRFGAAQVAA
jgi:helicase